MKDSVAIAGIPLTCGSAILQGFVPSYDATVTDRILRAGAEIVCITNMDDLAFSGGGESSWYGPTRNPFDPERSAGGSSSGAAAALWYDGIDLAVGCDQGGSIRAPASWCGVVGLKPTHSLVPYTGIAGIDATFDHCGPLARTAEGTALLLQAMAGTGPGRPAPVRGARAPTTSARSSAPAPTCSDLRIGIVTEGFSEAVGAEPATCDAVRAAAERLAGLGAELYERSLPEHLQAGGVAFAGFVEGMTALMTSGGNGIGWTGRYWEELAPAIVAGLRERGNELSPQVKAVLAAGVHLRERLGGAPYARAQNLRPWLRAAYDRALDDIDVLLHADHAVPRVPAGRRAAHERARPARLGQPRQHLPDRHVGPSRDLAPAGRGRRPAGRRHARRAPLRRRAPARDRRDLRAGARLGSGEAPQPQ